MGLTCQDALVQVPRLAYGVAATTRRVWEAASAAVLTGPLVVLGTAEGGFKVTMPWL